MTTNDATPREADRAVPEPDAIERAAKAMHEYRQYANPGMFGTWDEEIERDARHDELTYVQETRMEAANAIEGYLSAAPHGDLDAMLDSVHPRARVNWMAPQAGGGWAAGLVWWDFPTHDHIDPEMPLTQRPIVGTGPTRMAAIKDAVARARKDHKQ